MLDRRFRVRPAGMAAGGIAELSFQERQHRRQHCVLDRGGGVVVEIDRTAHQPGLYAFSVVPRAPNFCALRRVSSKAERA
jgi:ApbE superfamily uncharacterized protein (UPF0280 family)